MTYGEDGAADPHQVIPLGSYPGRAHCRRLLLLRHRRPGQGAAAAPGASGAPRLHAGGICHHPLRRKATCPCSPACTAIFKGKEYLLLGLARHSETLQTMVVYRALYGEGELWVRPAAMWEETVTRENYTGPRFTYLGPNPER